ncbi:hypothetical protein PENSPDRAFT_732694 [Peniophora sp. CONT]|nr:hypothetical protein PENSPDRAFT_732694 [Peniophora sp. CONT]
MALRENVLAPRWRPCVYIWMLHHRLCPPPSNSPTGFIRKRDGLYQYRLIHLAFDLTELYWINPSDVLRCFQQTATRRISINCLVPTSRFISVPCCPLSTNHKLKQMRLVLSTPGMNRLSAGYCAEVDRYSELCCAQSWTEYREGMSAPTTLLIPRDAYLRAMKIEMREPHPAVRNYRVHMEDEECMQEEMNRAYQASSTLRVRAASAPPCPRTIPFMFHRRAPLSEAAYMHRA